MKNLKTFTQLNESVNEGGKIEIWEDVQSVDDVVNILHALIDEGHFDNHGFPKSNLEDVNSFLAEQGHDVEGGYFKTDDDMNNFTNIVKSAMQELTAKL